MEEILKLRLWTLLRRNLPRVLSQLNRDPDSPLFGSFDRNFWHYKIRDFSSMILQQGMLIPGILKSQELPDNPFYQHPLMDQWTEGSLQFWASQQLKNGSFNEYYPYEEGFPPTAFSLYAVGLIYGKDGSPAPGEKVQQAIRKACDWLARHPEKEALNQEIAGLAGLTLCSRIEGVKVDAGMLEQRLSQFYSRQSPEGWFPEYDGPDTGYLSVTIDCLWDIYEHTGDERALLAMNKAVHYIATMISVSGETPVMINSRNTDYIVLYGITRLAKNNPEASLVLERLLMNTGKPDHYLNRTDDRYISHYVYQSCFRSLPFLDEVTHEGATLPVDNREKLILKDSGIVVDHSRQHGSVYVNARKGGIITIFGKEGVREADYGWRGKLPGRKIAVTHWLRMSYDVVFEESDRLLISGKMSAHSWMVPTPFRHIVLRAISRLFGNRLIPSLKKAMIFGDKESGISFTREITFHDEWMDVEDVFKGTDEILKGLYRAPHYSMRHVSSAGLFVPEELIAIPASEAVPGNGQVSYKRTISYGPLTG